MNPLTCAKRLSLLLALLLTVLASGCGSSQNFVFTGDNPNPIPGTAPTVTFVTPANGATQVPLNTKVLATFSETMDAATINNTTFTLTGPGNQAIVGTVTSFGLTATFTPGQDLLPSTTYTATISTGARGNNNIALANPFVWTFTTGTTPDTTAPTVTFTDPVNNETGVATNKRVAATFSEPMDPATINNANFTLTGPGATPVAGSVSFVGLVATFTPNANLAANTTYTARVSNNVTDLAGNAMAANFVWTFSTGVAPDTTAPTVTFTDPANNETGVATNTRVAATFSESMEPVTINNVNFTLTGPGATPVAGTVTFVGLVATFTPNADLAANTTFTARVSDQVRDLAGNAMAADFVWTFTTGAAPDITAPTVTFTDPANNETGVATNKRVAATFSETMDPATINNVNFTLTGPGATPVAGTVTFVGLVATFTPNSDLAANTSFTARVSDQVRDLAGNRMAADFVWAFTTGAAPDTTAPTVTSTDPANNETGVATNKQIRATFSESMDPVTITNVNFTLTGPGATPVAGTVTYVGLVATFTPNANLEAGTTYTASVSDQVRDLAGNQMAANFTWTFITGAAPDTTAPTVTSTDPANNETGVALNKKIAVTFSESMSPATITNVNFTLTGPGATPVTGTVTYVGLVATFSPSANLAGNTVYTAKVNNQVRDLAGNAMVADFIWTFTTGAAPDTTAPIITSTNPQDGATNVAAESNITATFNEGMDPATINNVNFVLRGPGAVLVPATVTYNAVTRVATLDPTTDLDTNTNYTATVTTGARDLAGNPLASDVSWSFTTRVVALEAIAPFGSFGGGAGITNEGILTRIQGDIGTSGAATTITGFVDSTGTEFTVTPLNRGEVSGVIYTATTPPGSEGVAANAALSARQAYNELVALPTDTLLDNDQLGGRTLAPGVYTAPAGSLMLTGSDLTLDAQGDPNAVWVFQMGTSLTVGAPAAPRSIILINSASPANVYWQVGSAATINEAGGGRMVGTIIAQAGVVISTAGNVDLVVLDGRAIGLDASVTMVNTIINIPI